MHPLCRSESIRDRLRGRKQNPCPAMHILRGCHRPGDRLQSPTPLASKTKASPNAHLRKRPVEEVPPRDGLALAEKILAGKAVNLA